MAKAKKTKAKKVIKKIKPVKDKKTVKKEKLIGKITLYFSDFKVAVVDLSSPIKEGDEIRIVGGENTDFNQEVESMQIDHEKVKSAKKGDSVGIKVNEKVHEGYRVFKV